MKTSYFQVNTTAKEFNFTSKVRIIFMNDHLRTQLVYTMDHEVLLGCCKSVDWLLNSSQYHLSLHQGKDGIVTIKVKVL